MALVEARLDLVYGVGCECDAHKGRDSLDRVLLAWRLDYGRGLNEWLGCG